VDGDADDQRETMNGIRVSLGQRPHYYDGQLLRAEDFMAEQGYHVRARQNHNKLLYDDWGVVRGLAVTPAQDRSVRVAPGAAIDDAGNDIRLDESSVIDLGEFRPRDRAHVCLAYEEVSRNGKDASRVDCYAVLTAAHESSGLVLASIALDDQGKVNAAAIDYTLTKYARLAVGSITAAQLHDELRRGWFRSTFRPDPMVEGPEEGTEAGLPAFRIGATEALSPDPREAGDRDRGAAGTMGIPIPPSARHVTRFRIAGIENKGEISFLLMRGGWEPDARKHVRDVLLDEKIVRKEPFLETYNVKEGSTALNPEYHTLALWLKGTRRTSISLVAVEFAY
jgi:hypothetical protein